jgi:ABC-type sulfate transport system substrate-binding protein
MEDMKVANVEFDNWGDEDDPESNWNKFLTDNTFSHSEACEFILYCGDDQAIANWDGCLFSEDVINILKEAKAAGFKYVCFHT